VRSGRDAWLLAAMGAILVEERLIDTAWRGAHASGIEDVVGALSKRPDHRVLRDPRRRGIPRARGGASHRSRVERRGLRGPRRPDEPALHTGELSRKLVWLLTDNLGRPGAQYAPATFVPIVRASRNELDPATAPRSPVVGARILTGVIPCNVIPDEILTDHPRRDRALFRPHSTPTGRTSLRWAARRPSFPLPPSPAAGIGLADHTFSLFDTR
jgi:hypothetical protein